MPVSEKGENSFGGNGLTIIDSLDTLYRAAKHFVEHDFAFHGRINVFEHTIRLFLEKAELVGEALLGAFANRIPAVGEW